MIDYLASKSGLGPQELPQEDVLEFEPAPSADPAEPPAPEAEPDAEAPAHVSHGA